MKKRYTKRLGRFSMLLLCAVCTVAVSYSLITNKNVSIIPTQSIELSYRSASPIGDIGGVALPASCESNAWNANGGYHLDGVTSDPGNCTAKVVVEPAPEPGQCGASNGVEQTAAPSTGLCTKGTPTAVTGSGPWKWTCLGINSGSSDECTAPKQNAVNNPPNTPDITGDIWAIVGKPTANWVLSTDPESDDIYYEIDWNYAGSFTVEGKTDTKPSGFNTPIGHIYNTVGTYTVKARAVQANDPSKVSGLGTYTIRVVPTDGNCSAPANACGATNGTVVGGQCVAPGLPAGYGDSCSGPANMCNMKNGGGTIGCDGTCSEKKAPSNTLCGCTGPANICGMTNTGNYNAAGTTCLASAPSNTLCSCTSEENACGMTNTGNYNAAGTTCLASAPSDSLCPEPGVGTVINDFRASPKLVAINKISKLYWDISGNRKGCTISYTKVPNGPAITVVPTVATKIGQIDTTPITEKRYYHLTCGSVTREAIVSPYSLTEI